MKMHQQKKAVDTITVIDGLLFPEWRYIERLVTILNGRRDCFTPCASQWLLLDLIARSGQAIQAIERDEEQKVLIAELT